MATTDTRRNGRHYPPGPSATVFSETPDWRDGCFRQSFKITASMAMTPDVFQRCYATAQKMFRGALAMNGYGPNDYSWPPQEFSEPAQDLRSGVVMFVVLAKKPPDYNPPPGAPIN